MLNRLIGPRCIVAHDVPCEGFNIDHVVIAPRCVYAVETKSFRKPRGSDDNSHFKVSFDGAALRFPDFVDTNAIEQARRQAQWLARYLRESLVGDTRHPGRRPPRLVDRAHRRRTPQRRARLHPHGAWCRVPAGWGGEPGPAQALAHRPSHLTEVSERRGTELNPH
ncbi:NERD domain-containing protein [Pseudoxanthomonas sp. NC8]|nr:NERD domain-containing protein [Pseudoxanthomonas sp. NC8]